MRVPRVRYGCEKSPRAKLKVKLTAVIRVSVTQFAALFAGRRSGLARDIALAFETTLVRRRSRN